MAELQQLHAWVEASQTLKQFTQKRDPLDKANSSN
jgi:hypothetical protein